MKLPDITISIIDTNNRNIVLNCLQSLHDTKGELNLEIFVVNNACTDGSHQVIKERFPHVRQIDNEQMFGFSTNNNLVFAKATGRYLMLLNDDTIVQPGAFQSMLAFMDANPEIGVVGASLLNTDGTWQVCYENNPNPFYDGLRPLSEFLFPIRQVNQPMEVGYVCGACMMVRSSVASKVGYLDERFNPLYSEEVDWCYRIQQAGWKVFHLPQAKVIHLGGSTMNRSSINKCDRIYAKKALFFRKHYSRKVVIAYKSTLFVANLIKSLAWLVFWILHKPEAEEELKIHWYITRRALFL